MNRHVHTRIILWAVQRDADGLFGIADLATVEENVQDEQVLATVETAFKVVEENLQVRDIITEKRREVQTTWNTVLVYIIIRAAIVTKVRTEMIYNVPLAEHKTSQKGPAVFAASLLPFYPVDGFTARVYSKTCQESYHRPQTVRLWQVISAISRKPQDGSINFSLLLRKTWKWQTTTEKPSSEYPRFSIQAIQDLHKRLKREAHWAPNVCPDFSINMPNHFILFFSPLFPWRRCYIKQNLEVK